MRKADAKAAKAAATKTAAVQVQIQEEIDATKKQRRRATRQQERAQQFDRQREEIHPTHGLERLERFAFPAEETIHLEKAIPDPERSSSSQPLLIRSRERETDQWPLAPYPFSTALL
jgi:hypothetical protein